MNALSEALRGVRRVRVVRQVRGADAGFADERGGGAVAVPHCLRQT